MYSIKQNILQTVALLKEYGVNQIVISPGSRNTPIIESCYNDPFFTCHLIVDERSAAFHALGMIQSLQMPVAVCCTSGSAVLNYAPAVAEAYYQQLPLIVLSADRCEEWIGQMDGQTIIQNNVFGNYIKKSVQLPEIKDESDQWYCNRLINEALICSTSGARGPVHINIPISEPLFDFSANTLPEVRVIKKTEIEKNIADIDDLAGAWQHLKKRMIIIGQSDYSEALNNLLEKITSTADCIVLSEHISNHNSSVFIHNFDAIIGSLEQDQIIDFVPDLVITAGGHIVSKKVKQVLRKYRPKEHWHITESEDIPDLFQSLTRLINIKAESFFFDLCQNIQKDTVFSYSDNWKKESRNIKEPRLSYADIGIVGTFLKKLPKASILHLANSSVIRNAQLFAIDPSIRIYCNRGTNGIEGSLASAIGFASATDKMVYLLVGDLSFFYGLNTLWNISHINNIRILLINNQGGGIFHLLPDSSDCRALDEYVTASHTSSAEKWVEAAGLKYLKATNMEEYLNNLDVFLDETEQSPVLFEVITDNRVNIEEHFMYYKTIKSKRNENK